MDAFYELPHERFFIAIMLFIETIMLAVTVLAKEFHIAIILIAIMLFTPYIKQMRYIEIFGLRLSREIKNLENKYTLIDTKINQVLINKNISIGSLQGELNVIQKGLPNEVSECINKSAKEVNNHGNTSRKS